MRDTKRHTINGFNYDITQLGAKQGRRVLARIIRLAAGAADGEDPISKLVAGLTDAEVDFLCDTFAQTTLVAKVETPDKQVLLMDQFDLHFAGNYGDMVKWLWAALQTNYESFFAGLGLSAEGLKAAAENAMSGTLTSPIARSGDSSKPATGG